MIYFILDNIYNTNITNGIFLRYQNLIQYLLQHKQSVTLITREVNDIIYPTSPLFHVKFAYFIQVPMYPDLYIPVSVDETIPLNSTVITLLEYVSLIPYLILNQDKFKLILGYHTRMDLYSIEMLYSRCWHDSLEIVASNLTPQYVLATGHSTDEMVRRLFPNARIHIWYEISNLFLLNKFTPRYYDITQKPITLIYTGRLSIEKGIKDLFHVYSRCKDKYTTRLEIYGIGPLLTELLETYKQDSNVRFNGNIPQMLMYETYNSFPNPLFIFPSKSETLGKSPIEASLCGIPVFTAESDETRYIYKHKHNGFVFQSPTMCCFYIDKFIAMNSNKQNRIIRNGFKLKHLFDNQANYKQISVFCKDGGK